MNAPEQSDASGVGGEENGENGEISEAPQGNASAFRRALDAQAMTDGLGRAALVPSGPHDLTMPIERVRIPEESVAPQPGGISADPGAAAAAEAAGKNARTRVPPWSPSIRWIGADGAAAGAGAGAVADDPGRLVQEAAPRPSGNPARIGALSIAALKSRGPEKFGRIRLAVVASAALAAVAAIVFVMISEASAPRLVPSSLPTVPIMSGGALVPGVSASGAKASADASAKASGHATATATRSASASAHASASGTAKATASGTASTVVAAGAVTPSATGTATIASGTVVTTTASGSALANAQTGDCLDTSSFSSDAAEQVAPCSGSTFQAWAVTSTGELTQDGGSYCLDDYGWGSSPGSAVDLWPCNGGSNQQWTVASNGTVVGAYSSLCLSLSGSSVVLEDCSSQTTEKWSWQ